MSNILYDIIKQHTDANNRELDVLDQWIKRLATDAKTTNVLSGSRGLGSSVYSGNLELGDAGGITLFSAAGKKTIWLSNDGDAFLGADIDKPASTSWAAFGPGKVYNFESMGAGDVLFGDNTSSKANMKWDASTGQLLFRSGQVPAMVLDTTGVLKVTASDPNILIDGPNGQIRSSNWVEDQAGFMISKLGDAQFMNINVRGKIRSSVFEIGEITATAGTTGVYYSATTLYADHTMVVGENYIYLSNTDENPTAAICSVNDWILIKTWNGDQMVNIYGKVRTIMSTGTGYTYIRWYIPNSSSHIGVKLTKGMPVINYGPAQSGFITQSADGQIGESANLTIAKHAAGAVTILGAIDNGGTGYTVGDVLTLVESGAGGCTVRVDTLGPSNTVTGVTKLTNGYGYINSGSKSTTGGTGTDCYISVNTISGPWDTYDVMARMGNLYGSFGAGSNDYYGFGVGDYASGNYLVYNNDGSGTWKLSAGDAAVTMDENGIKIKGTDGYTAQNAIAFWDTTQGFSYPIGYWYVGETVAGGHYGQIRVNTASTGKDSQMDVRSSAGATDLAQTFVVAESSGAPTYLQLFSDNSLGTGSKKIAVLSSELTTLTDDVRIGKGLVVGDSSLTVQNDDVTYTGNLISHKNSVYENVYAFHPLSSWSARLNVTGGGDVAATQLTLTGIPTSAVAVAVRLLFKDSAASGGNQYLAVGPNSTYYTAVMCRAQASGVWNENSGVCTTYTTGNVIYYRAEASGAATADYQLFVTGYWI